MSKLKWTIINILLNFYFPYQKLHHFCISFKKNKNTTKIFCIGSPRTGTTSLTKALKILGYNSVRIYDWSSFFNKGEDFYINKVKKSSYETFADWPFGDDDLYKKIDKKIPNSLFILTVRDKKSLKKSWLSHFKYSLMEEQIFNEIDFLIDKIQNRDENIISYFKNNKSKLLVLNLFEGDSWEKLCNFLGKIIPDHPFPHKNIGSYHKKGFLQNKNK